MKLDFVHEKVIEGDSCSYEKLRNLHLLLIWELCTMFLNFLQALLIDSCLGHSAGKVSKT